SLANGATLTSDPFDVLATAPVATAPVVTKQPVSQAVTAGATVTFTADATGVPPPTVKWQVSTDGGATFNDMTGPPQEYVLSFVTTAAENGNEYRAVFDNGSGTVAATDPATLTIQSAPTISTPPAGTSLQVGQTATFTVSAAGSPAPSFRWQESSDGGATFTDITGNASAATATLTLTGVPLTE